MKVLLSAYACEPHRGSELGNGWNWALHLVRTGHSVTVLTRIHGRDAIELELSRLNEDNLRVIYVDVPPWSKGLLRGQMGVFAHYFLWQRMALASARQLSLKPEIVHHVTWGSLHGSSELWRLNAPFVFGPAGGGQTAPPAFREYFGNGWKAERVRSFVTNYLLPWNISIRRMLHHSTLALATNDETARAMRKLGAHSVEKFLDTGISEELVVNEVPERTHHKGLRILWVARLYPRKALPLALEVMSRTHGDCSLTIIGDGPCRSEVHRWIHKFDLADRVDWRGQQSWSEVMEAYKTHDIFLFPTLRDSCPGQLLEAMANGLPVVTLDHHGSRVLVPTNAGIRVPVTAPSETVDGLVTAINALGRNPSLRHSMGQAGIEFAKTQTWPARAKAMTKLYKVLASESGAIPEDERLLCD